MPISGLIIMDQALKIAPAMKIKFKASSGWWKKRYCVKCKEINGNSGIIDQKLATDRVERLPTIANGYSDNANFNMDQTGLFYYKLARQNFVYLKDECHEGKFSKKDLV